MFAFLQTQLNIYEKAVNLKMLIAIISCLIFNLFIIIVTSSSKNSDL